MAVIPKADRQRVLHAFPKLYYFIPPGEVRTIRDKEATIVLSEPVRAVLWLMDTMTAENPVVTSEALGKIIARLYRREQFSKTISQLRRAGCIDAKPLS